MITSRGIDGRRERASEPLIQLLLKKLEHEGFIDTDWWSEGEDNDIVYILAGIADQWIKEAKP